MEEKPTHAKPSLYAHYFESLKEIAKEYGYNLVLHGSMSRDLDLVAIPWVDNPRDEFKMIQHFKRHLTGFENDQLSEYLYSVLAGGRNSYVINLNRGGAWNNYDDKQYYIDICVTPLVVANVL